MVTAAAGWPLLAGRSFAGRTLSGGTAGTDAAREQAAGVAPVQSAAAPVPGLPAERVLGIGGFFFRSRDPKALAEWYRVHLGVVPVAASYGEPSWHTEAGTTVFAPFPQTTKYFGEQSQGWMMNFRVRDLERMAAQLRAAGVEVKVDPERYPNGRFARIHDPEGNPVELWEPAGPNA